MKTKKMLAILAATAFVVSLVGCGSKNKAK